MEDSVLTVIVADDEPGARAALRSILAEEHGIRIVGEASDGPSTIALLRERRPDLVLLDSRLPRLSALELLSGLGSRTLPLLIVVTPSGDRRPELNGDHTAGWLQKPVSAARLREVLQRARGHLGGAGPRSTAQARIAVKAGSRVEMIDLDSILHVASANNHSRVTTRDRTVSVRENLGALAERLPAGQFVRVNRFTLINAAAVTSLESKSHGDWIVHLLNGARFTVSRTRRSEVLRRLRIAP